MPIPIGQTSKTYDTSMEDWTLSTSLVGGIKAMKENCAEFLPRWSQETPENYDARVAYSNLYNVFRRTVRSLSGKPFGKQVVLDKVPAPLEDIEHDVDRDRQTLSQFGRECTAAVLTFGLTHVLIDSPRFEGALSVKNQREMNIHPYFVHVKPDSLIYWSFVRGMTGEMILNEIHIRSEDVDDENEEWLYIKVWSRESIQLWRRKKHTDTKAEYELIEDFENPINLVPLVTIYSDVSKKGLMVGDSPLDDLAQLNLRHFRSQSDQDTCLHFARVPFLHFAGFQKEEVDRTISVNNSYVSTNPTSKIMWVETQGASLAAGAKDLEALEARMDVMGADLLVQKPGNPTATAKAIDSAEKISDLQAITMAVEDGIVECYRLAGVWVNLRDVEVEVELFKNFGMSLKDKSELDVLLKARIAGEISRETWLKELARRGLTDDLNVEEELDRLALDDEREEAAVTEV